MRLFIVMGAPPDFIFRTSFLLITNPAADPGFPIGGGADLQRGHFSAETYVKTKELGPV